MTDKERYEAAMEENHKLREELSRTDQAQRQILCKPILRQPGQQPQQLGSKARSPQHFKPFHFQEQAADGESQRRLKMRLEKTTFNTFILI